MPTIPKAPTPIATDLPIPKKRSLGVAAGQLFEKLKRLDEEERLELDNAPHSIRERYATKRAKLVATAGSNVTDLVSRMREPAPEKPE